MNDWFTVKKVDTQTFAISEYQHWEETHCYLICGQKKAVLVDTGYVSLSKIQLYPATPSRHKHKPKVEFWLEFSRIHIKAHFATLLFGRYRV